MTNYLVLLTRHMTQGEGFSAGMQCAFVEPGNGTLAAVAATVVDSSSIQCTTPAWQPTAPSWQVHPVSICAHSHADVIPRPCSSLL